MKTSIDIDNRNLSDQILVLEDEVKALREERIKLYTRISELTGERDQARMVMERALIEAGAIR